MTEQRKLIFDAIVALADRASEHEETTAASSVLYALSGSLIGGYDERIMEIVTIEVMRTMEKNLAPKGAP